MRYLGIDYGLKKIGLALGDDETRISSPAEVIVNDDRLLVRLAELVEKEGVDAIVVGVPLPTNDRPTSKQLEITRKFIEELGRVLKTPIHEVDERYTSGEARRLQKEHGAEAREDALAAMILLQAYLDEHGVVDV